MRDKPLALISVVLAFLLFSAILAQGAKTSDLLTISGARSTLKFKSGDEQGTEPNRLYIATGTIQIIRHNLQQPLPPKPKQPATPPQTLEVSVSVRGIPEAGVFLITANSPMPDSLAACGGERHLWLDFEMPADPITVGYISCFPANRFDKAQGDILIAANDAEPEKIPIAFERQEGFFSSPTANALLSPALTGLGGLVGGAVIGFLGFLAQQRYLRRSEQTKAFRERKLQSIHKLVDFFRDTYPVYRNAAETEEPTKLRQLRECLIRGDIYAILAPDEIGKLEDLFHRNIFSGLGRSRIQDFDDLMEDSFGEFMPPEQRK